MTTGAMWGNVPHVVQLRRLSPDIILIISFAKYCAYIRAKSRAPSSNVCWSMLKKLPDGQFWWSGAPRRWNTGTAKALKSHRLRYPSSILCVQVRILRSVVMETGVLTSDASAPLLLLLTRLHRLLVPPPPARTCNLQSPTARLSRHELSSPNLRDVKLFLDKSVCGECPKSASPKFNKEMTRTWA